MRRATHNLFQLLTAGNSGHTGEISHQETRWTYRKAINSKKGDQFEESKLTTAMTPALPTINREGTNGPGNRYRKTFSVYLLVLRPRGLKENHRDRLASRGGSHWY